MIIATCLMMGISRLQSQDLPGLSYCLLFDSKLEKQAFQGCSDEDRDPLVYLLAYDPNVDSVQYDKLRNQLTSYARELLISQVKFKSKSRFLHHVFYKVHRKFLRQYKQVEPFNGLFNGGGYNCVSGTALYAFFLEQLGISYTIYETRYHIFLLACLPDSTRILFEATDPLDGFVEHPVMVQQRIVQYVSDEKRRMRETLDISAPFSDKAILQAVSLKELGGLHYYNLAVDLINKQNYYDAFRALKKASLLYPDSQRIKDFLEFTSALYDDQLSTAFH